MCHNSISFLVSFHDFISPSQDILTIYLNCHHFTDDVTQAMDGTSKSSEYVLIGWITALAILVIVSNIPSAILVYKHLRRKRMTGQTPNESRNSSEAEMDNLQQNLQQNPQPAPPPGPLPRPTSPSVGDPDQTTRMAAEPASQPWGLPDPYNTSHDPADSDQTTRRSISRRPDSGGQSLANVARFDATYDRDQTNSLSLFGGGDRYQPQPCTSDGEYILIQIGTVGTFITVC